MTTNDKRGAMPSLGSDIFPVRCSIRTTKVHTRRFSSTAPNLLAIPVRTETGKKLRSCYRCLPGYLLGSWDLSQIEMRVMADESKDKLLCRLFREGRDIHTETAAKIFRIPLESVDKYRHRLPAKNAGFGVIYGIQGPGLLAQLNMLKITGWTADSCQRLISDWLNLYSGVKAFIARIAAETRKHPLGLVRDRSGNMRYLPGIWDPKPSVAAEAARQAVSHIIQGTAQVMIQRSMIWLAGRIRELQRNGADVHWVLQIHDEVIFHFERDLAPVVHDLVIEALTKHSGINLIVPIEAEGRCGETWGELK